MVSDTLSSSVGTFSKIGQKIVNDSHFLGDLAGHARITPLKGFSGCIVVLIEERDGKVFVRKIAADLSYNERLIRQIDKQQRFQTSPACRSIEIIGSGYLRSGLAYADMNYVQGITVAEMLYTVPLSKVSDLAYSLLDIGIPLTDVTNSTLPRSIFIEKIKSVEREIIKRRYNTPTIMSAIKRLYQRSWDDVPMSLCHGDLTLENIIYHDNKFFLFDFLDSFAESWFIDISKLFQDLIARWSFRHGTVDRNLALRLAALRYNIEACIRERYPEALSSIHALYVLALIRVIPYATDTHERVFIDGCVATALNEIL